MRAGFSLVELLVVMAILAILASIGTGLVWVAQRSGRTTNTQVLLSKVDAALRQFKGDTGVLPWHAWDPAAPPATWNNLGQRLGTAMDDARRAAVAAESDEAADAYRLRADPSSTVAYYWHDGQLRRFTPDRANQRANASEAHLIALNRLGSERARLLVLAGVTRPRAPRWDSAAKRWLPDGPDLVATPRPLAADGWCDDYLGNALTARDRLSGSPGTLVDRWNRPLVHVCPVLPGVRGFIPRAGDPRIDETYYGLAPAGRSASAAADADLRTTATAQAVLEPEVLSAGNDGRIEPVRNDLANRDNVQLERKKAP